MANPAVFLRGSQQSRQVVSLVASPAAYPLIGQPIGLALSQVVALVRDLPVYLVANPAVFLRGSQQSRRVISLVASPAAYQLIGQPIGLALSQVVALVLDLPVYLVANPAVFLRGSQQSRQVVILVEIPAAYQVTNQVPNLQAILVEIQVVNLL